MIVGKSRVDSQPSSISLAALSISSKYFLQTSEDEAPGAVNLRD